ncbi:hypothetical protein [Gemmatimonas sp.]|uniref:hypothetical protein n=1 Tax=Gemmatimonas sp. TaxID=1962908 RepID=UPI003568A089
MSGWGTLCLTIAINLFACCVSGERLILFPAALGIAAALALGSDASMASTAAVCAGLLVAIAAVKATRMLAWAGCYFFRDNCRCRGL